jgi:hypothetical protein
MTCSVRSRYHQASLADQTSAGPACGKGDRRAMAVIHTASRRRLAVQTYVLILFSLQRQGKIERKTKSKAASAPRVPGNEKSRVLFLGHTFWMQNQIVIGRVRYFAAIAKSPRIDAHSG